MRLATEPTRNHHSALVANLHVLKVLGGRITLLSQSTGSPARLWLGKRRSCPFPNPRTTTNNLTCTIWIRITDHERLDERRGISRGACSLSAQGPYGVNRGGAQRRNEAGNRSRRHQHGNGDGHDRHTHAGDLIKLRLHVPHAEDCHRDANSEAGDGLQHGAAHDRSDDAGARGSQCHAYADLRRAADDGMGCDAIQTDGGEEKGQQAEQRREARDQPLLDEPIVNLLLECLELDDGEVGIDARQCVADDLFEAGDGMGGLNHRWLRHTWIGPFREDCRGLECRQAV